MTTGVRATVHSRIARIDDLRVERLNNPLEQVIDIRSVRDYLRPDPSDRTNIRGRHGIVVCLTQYRGWTESMVVINSHLRRMRSRSSGRARSSSIDRAYCCATSVQLRTRPLSDPERVG